MVRDLKKSPISFYYMTPDNETTGTIATLVVSCTLLIFAVLLALVYALLRGARKFKEGVKWADDNHTSLNKQRTVYLLNKLRITGSGAMPAVGAEMSKWYDDNITGADGVSPI